MVEFRLDREASLRLLETVVATVSRARPLSPDRAGLLQAVGGRFGLGFQDLADVTRDPRLRAPSGRSEAEATYLVAAMVLSIGGKSEEEQRLLTSLGGALELGVAVRELDQLALQPTTLQGFKPKPTTGRPSDRQPRPRTTTRRQPVRGSDAEPLAWEAEAKLEAELQPLDPREAARAVERESERYRRDRLQAQAELEEPLSPEAAAAALEAITQSRPRLLDTPDAMQALQPSDLKTKARATGRPARKPAKPVTKRQPPPPDLPRPEPEPEPEPPLPPRRSRVLPGLLAIAAVVGGLAGVYFGQPDLLPSNLRAFLDRQLGR